LDQGELPPQPQQQTAQTQRHLVSLPKVVDTVDTEILPTQDPQQVQMAALEVAGLDIIQVDQQHNQVQHQAGTDLLAALQTMACQVVAEQAEQV
jgi:septal ring factor EnvC (AmiA/AmiB activator)